MVVTHPRDALELAHEHARSLREEAATQHPRRAIGRRRALATSLRRMADRIDPAPLVHTPA
jgi:hypothetical protein